MNKLAYSFLLMIVLCAYTGMAQSSGMNSSSAVTDQITGMQGTYYIGAAGTGPGGTNPEFPTFRSALDSINNATFSGNCTFYITSDVTETYADTRGLGLAVNPDPYTITFKPYPGVQPTITLNYPSDMNSGPSGAFVIGIPGKGNVTWDSLRATRNIIIDGSNTLNGTTRDLTIQSATTSHRNAIPLVVVGDVSNVIIKNTKIYYKTQTVSTSGNLFIGSVMIRHRNYLGVDWVPHNLTFENNHLNANFDGNAQNAQGYGTYQTGTPVPLNYPYNITLKNNLIEGKRRGIALNLSGSHDIFGNEIMINQNIAANTTNEAILCSNLDTGSVVNIYRNKISKVSSMTNLAGSGISAISIESFGIYNVHNNIIYGFALTASNPVAYVRGIRNSSQSATLNCYFNSIYMTDILAGGTVAYAGILISNGINDLKNNIVHSAVVDFATYCIYRDGALGTLTADYNNYSCADATNGNVGYWNSAAAHTLASWQTASSLDAHSLSVNPGFVSSTDLHLTANTSPMVGKGIVVSGITVDFDGDLRDNIPEIGADEFPGFIPVELISFTVSREGNRLVLRWETATETNNSHFVVEKKSGNNLFRSIGMIKGAGTSAQKRNYIFTDEVTGTGKITYRLKQVDFDGSVSYSNSVETETGIADDYTLDQNYPNPFNPATTINYSLPVASNISIAVYNMNGELVTTLVNGYKEAGNHTVEFNAENLPSGVYVYRLTAGSFTLTRKMNLLK